MRAWVLLAALCLASCASAPSRERRGLFDYDANGSAPKMDGSHASDREPASGCRPLSMKDRLDLLKIADPENFPSTRYRRAPKRAVEKETDCSHFVHEIYRRAGLRYNFKASDELKYAPEFELLPEEEAMPGDLMLFRGHVGLVDHDGRIISATYTHKRKRKSSITRLRRTAFKPLRGRISVLRYRCRPPEALRQIAQEKPVPAKRKNKQTHHD